MQAIVECQRLFLISRSSRVEVFCEKRILKNFTKFPGKHLCRGLFFKRLSLVATSVIPVVFILRFVNIYLVLQDLVMKTFLEIFEVCNKNI